MWRFIKNYVKYYMLFREFLRIQRRGNYLNYFLIMDLMEPYKGKYRVSNDGFNVFISLTGKLQGSIYDRCNESGVFKQTVGRDSIFYAPANKEHQLLLRYSAHIECLKRVVYSLPVNRDLTNDQVDLITRMSHYRWDHGSL